METAVLSKEHPEISSRVTGELLFSYKGKEHYPLLSTASLPRKHSVKNSKDLTQDKSLFQDKNQFCLVKQS